MPFTCTFTLPGTINSCRVTISLFSSSLVGVLWKHTPLHIGIFKMKSEQRDEAFILRIINVVIDPVFLSNWKGVLLCD